MARRNLSLGALILVFLPVPVWGQLARVKTWEDKGRHILKGAKEKSSQAMDQVQEAGNASHTARGLSTFYFTGHFTYFDLLLPGKLGVTAGYQMNADEAVEVNYMQASFAPLFIKELGEFKEKRILLQKRNYFGGTFSFMYGLAYNMMSLELGSSYFDLMPIPELAKFHQSMFEVHTLGTQFAIGNRWIFGNHFTFGIDWIGYSQPLFKVKEEKQVLEYVDEDEKDKVETTLQAMTYFPRFVLLNGYIGVTF